MTNKEMMGIMRKSTVPFQAHYWRQQQVAGKPVVCTERNSKESRHRRAADKPVCLRYGKDFFSAIVAARWKNKK
jgi:hypothetical protein